MLRIAVCEDERIHIDLLEEALVHFFMNRREDHQLQVFRSAQELLEAPDNYDILLLDISLGDGDGIETAVRLREQGNIALIILVTSRSDRYKDGYNATVFRYLEKPLDQALFNKAMEDALYCLSLSHMVLRVHYRSQERMIPVHQIIYIENSLHNRKVHYLLTNGQEEEQTTSDPWSALTKQLPEERFMFVQKSFLVNAKHIAGVSATRVRMDTGHEFNISKSKRGEFEKKYMRFVEKL